MSPVALDDVRVVRFIEAGGPAAVGAVSGGVIYPLPVASHTELLRMNLGDLRLCVEGALDKYPRELGATTLLPIIDARTEVWAAGVTYLSSRMAREDESQEPTVYSRVYDHHRPELFFKAPAWRVVNDGEPIRVRGDSDLNVPEPELALVLSNVGEILGYTICNDVSSRTIEGENPLYLPQAKVYDASCALAASWTPAWAIPDPYGLTIEISIRRGREVIWADSATTSLLHRDLDGLAAVLFAELSMPDGAILATGTCLAPAMDVTLLDRDVVSISISGVGQLTNPVVQPVPMTLTSSIRR
ncbi:MAG: Fumarylacetoacetate hydrolase family protein [Pseudonocardiales bacterium]|nr:Fumarylacetoacetate hydrolase family protein [Pseudonocardiales bacterium]